MLIPNRIKVGAVNYQVQTPHMMRRAGSRGDINYGAGVIRVAVHSNLTGRKLNPKQRSETFWHELIHGILDDMEQYALGSNEKFVKGFSQRLNDAIHSADFQ